MKTKIEKKGNAKASEARLRFKGIELSKNLNIKYNMAKFWLVPENENLEKWNPPWDFNWSNRKLWALDVPISEIHIKRLSWILLRPIWSTLKGKDLRNLVPYDVIKHPTLFKAHYQRILKTDLHFPIDCIWICGKYYILDGVHRLAKNMIKNNMTIQVRKIKKEHIALIRNEKAGRNTKGSN